MLGLILAVVVYPANIQDRAGARLVLERAHRRFPQLSKIWGRPMLCRTVSPSMDSL
ncbi:MAG: hypothetical protein RMI90_01045 [Thermoguttaceae bacterium]|nr:hypothetical protein [Thermoguttaceae bacterium]